MRRKTISKLLPAILCVCTLAGCGTQNDTKQIETEMVATESIKETTDMMSEVESETVTEPTEIETNTAESSSELETQNQQDISGDIVSTVTQEDIDEYSTKYYISNNKDGKEYIVVSQSVETNRVFENVLELYDNDKVIQTINWETMFISMPVFEDFNLDGYQDIVLNDMEEIDNTKHIVYIWNAESNQYDKLTYDGIIGEYEIISENNEVQIINEYRNEKGKVQETLKWEENSLVLVDEKYIEESTIVENNYIQEVTTSNYTISKSNHTMSDELSSITDKRINIEIPKLSHIEGKEINNKEAIEIINKELELASVGDNKEWLLAQEIRELYGYTVEYNITYATDEVLSLCYYTEIADRRAVANYAQGTTFNPQTGEKIPVEKYTNIDKNLLEEVKNGNLHFGSDAGYDEEFMLGYLESFIDDYLSGNVDVYSCYYLSDNAINLIIPVSYSNSNYFILKIDINN